MFRYEELKRLTVFMEKFLEREGFYCNIVTGIGVLEQIRRT